MVMRRSVRTRILRIRRIHTDWFTVVSAEFSPLAKVFWKGEFEGKNLFFKKGFPLLIKLEKTSLKEGVSLLATESFFKRRDAAPDSCFALSVQMFFKPQRTQRNF